MPKEEKKLTLKEYQKKYNKPYNVKAAKTFLFLFAATIGVIIAACLFFVTVRIYEMNQYAGYVAIGVSVLVFILIYVIPLIKISKTKSFITNVDSTNINNAKKFNKKLREDLADKIIDLKTKTDEVTWYSDELVGKLAVARHTNDDKSLRLSLTSIYKTDINKSANKMIKDHSLKVGLTTAISQSERLDTLFVCAYDLNLIKDIIYLYGFRPNDRELAVIYKTVIADAIVAYGLSSVTSNLATGVATKIGKAANGIPIVGAIVGTVIDSVAQGVINASLTVLIGFQTKKYLMKEYNLQDILEDVIVTEEEELKAEEELMYELKDDIKNKSKDLKKDKVSA